MNPLLQHIDRLLRRSYEETVVLTLSGLAVLFATSFIVLRSAEQQWLHVIIDGAVLVTAILVWAYVWRTGRTAGPALAWSTVLVVLACSLVYLFGVQMLFWTYPLTASIYFLTQPFWAVVLSGATAAVIAPKALDLGPSTALLALYPSLLASNLLALAVVTAMNRHRLALRTMARRDALTGLASRRGLEHSLERMMGESRDSGDAVAVLMLDLDDFKLVNDTLGHAAGDELLREVAARLTACVRREDVLGRFGGDEFVIATRLVEPDEAARLAQRINEALLPPIMLGGSEVRANVSIGICRYPDNGLDADALWQAADTAKYAAKRAGKSQFRFFDESMNQALQSRLQTQSELHQALEEGELVLHYQPRVALDTTTTMAAEALLRWEHPRRGLLLPNEFLPMAENSALMERIDRYVLEKAAHQAVAWQRAGCRLTLSLNLTAAELHRKGFGREVAHLLLETGVDPSCIEIEITERVVMKHFDHALNQLRELRQCVPGLRLALDNFGRGQSSLQNLRLLPIDTLKIDRAVVVDVAKGDPDAKGPGIARAIVELGHHVGLRVVAEGIETADQAALLGELGCEEVQGFCFGYPVPPREFIGAVEGGSTPGSSADDAGRGR